MIDMSRNMEQTLLVVHDLPSKPVLDSKLIHIWFCDLDYDKVEPTCSILSPGERSRVERLKSPQDRRRLVTRFSFVRNVLANITGIEPAALKFCENSRGKPRLCGEDKTSEKLERLSFNISHTENILVLVVAFNSEVGIDIEVVRPGIDFFSTAKTYFSAENLDLLYALSPRKAATTFYRLWTRKEALAKVDGSGIAMPSDKNSMADSHLTLYSFEFKFDIKKIIGALALRFSVC